MVTTGKQMTRSHPARCAGWGGPGVRNRFRPAAGEHSARILGGARNDRWSQSYGRYLVRQLSHASILPVAVPASRQHSGSAASSMRDATRLVVDAQ